MKFLKAIYWRAYILRLAIRWIPQPNLGDLVWFEGCQWTLIQGVRDPIWTLKNEDSIVEANKADFRKVRSLKNWISSFLSGYRFYMGSWYSIWVTQGIEPWMLGCNIWAGKPPGSNQSRSTK